MIFRHRVQERERGEESAPRRRFLGRQWGSFCRQAGGAGSQLQRHGPRSHRFLRLLNKRCSGCALCSVSAHRVPAVLTARGPAGGFPSPHRPLRVPAPRCPTGTRAHTRLSCPTSLCRPVKQTSLLVPLLQSIWAVLDPSVILCKF